MPYKDKSSPAAKQSKLKRDAKYRKKNYLDIISRQVIRLRVRREAF